MGAPISRRPFAAAWPPGLGRALLASLAAHAGILAALAILAWLRPHFVHPPQRVLTTKLVRLGTPRPEALLPRMEPPPPAAEVPPKPAPPAPPSDPPSPLPPKPAPAVDRAATAPVPSARDRASALNRVHSALDRLRERAEGVADGARDGDVARAELAMLGDAFATEVAACVKRHWIIEGLSAAQVAALQAEVHVRVQADGRLSQGRIITGSGHAGFDQAVLRAVSRCGKVSPPAAKLARQLRQDGIQFTFDP